ncbi:hypothetical protein B9479_006091 [Cryptococcus floricola]|uniref:Uncharacterized protein n=1 Tax=Cryptococcus floricola TaxID=2591691 RepID=A0A5D3AP19_9TREE|nr:hypothetical protein B9479_006091 [Cryptococcus floricola]
MLTTRLLKIAIPKAESSKQAQQRVAHMARCISSIKGKERETCPPPSSFPPIISRLLSARLYRLATFHVVQTPSLAKDLSLLESLSTHLEYNGAERLAEGLRGISWKGGKARLGVTRRKGEQVGRIVERANQLGENRHQPPSSFWLGLENGAGLDGAASSGEQHALSRRISKRRSIPPSLSSLPSEISKYLPPSFPYSSSCANEPEDHLLRLSHTLLAIISHQADFPSQGLDQRTKGVVVGLWIAYARGYLRGRRRNGEYTSEIEDGKEPGEGDSGGVWGEKKGEGCDGREGSSAESWDLPPTAETVMLFFRHISLLLAPPTTPSSHSYSSNLLPSLPITQSTQSASPNTPSLPASTLLEPGQGAEKMKLQEEEGLEVDEEERRQEKEYEWDHLCRPLCRYTLRLLRLARSYHSRYPPVYQSSSEVGSMLAKPASSSASPSLLSAVSPPPPFSEIALLLSAQHSPPLPPPSPPPTAPRLPQEIYLRRKAAWERQLAHQVGEYGKEVRGWMGARKGVLLGGSFGV